MLTKWFGLRVIILGAARQGIALARYLAVCGARVILNDQRPAHEVAAARAALADLDLPGQVAFPITYVFGEHPLAILDNADLLCISGGVPLTIPLIADAQRRGLPLTNDSQIFLEAVTCQVIGITGSAGKTTTTTLVGRMAQSASEQAGTPSWQAWVGGNIGNPLIAQVTQIKPQDLVVMELSSFQLEVMTHSPQVAAILNITPNHLDRHGTMPAYQAAKAHILNFQSGKDIAVLGRDDPGAWSLAGQVRGRLYSFGLSALPEGQFGSYCLKNTIYIRDESGEQAVLSRSEISLRGEHNLLNVLAACAIAAAAGLPVEAMRTGVQGFHGVSHRLEFVRTWHGADWYNDSIATAPERSMAAIRSFSEPLVLLAGGRDKNLPWEDFARLVHQRVDHLILFGEARQKINDAIQKTEPGSQIERIEPLTIIQCEKLAEAVKAAANQVKPGDVVLLSPGGTSFDEFKDFEERGACFVQWVNALS